IVRGGVWPGSGRRRPQRSGNELPARQYRGRDRSDFRNHLAQSRRLKTTEPTEIHGKETVKVIGRARCPSAPLGEADAGTGWVKGNASRNCSAFHLPSRVRAAY